MSKTNRRPSPLLSFFERWVVGDGPRSVRRSFEADEYESGSGIVRYEPREDALVGLFLPHEADPNSTPFRRTYGDWLSRQARAEADRVLSLFADQVSGHWSSSSDMLAFKELEDEIRQLRKSCQRITDETLRLVVMTWLTRIREDAAMIIGEIEGLRKGRGGRPPDVDPKKLKEAIADLVKQGRFFHKSGPYTGMVNRSAIGKKLSDGKIASAHLVDPRHLDKLIKDATRELREEGRMR